MHVKIQFKKLLKDNRIFIGKYRFRHNFLNNIENELDYYNNLKAQ